MAVAYQSTQNDVQASATSITITKPTDTAEGDLMVGNIAFSATGRTITPPAGWTEVFTFDGNNGSQGGWWYRVAGDSEGANYAWSIDGGATPIAGTISRITGQGDMPNVFASGDDTLGSTASGATATFDMGLTPWITTSKILLFYITADEVGGGTTTTASYAIATDDPTWTEAFDLEGGANNMVMAYAAGRTEVTATGNWSAVVTNSLGNASFPVGVSILIAEDLDVTISPDPLVITSTVPAVAVTGTAVVSPTPAVITAAVPTVTVTVQTVDWTLETKPSTTWTFEDKP